MRLDEPESMSHDVVVDFVKQELEEEFKVKFEKIKEHLDRGVHSDLKTRDDMDERIIVIVHDKVRFTRTGKMVVQDLRKLLHEFSALMKIKTAKKILVLTDSTAFLEYKKYIEQEPWEGYLQRANDRYQVELKLVNFPIFKNNKSDGTKLAGRSLNDIFTASQLIGAMRFGLLDYDALSPDDKAKILTIMNRRNYLTNSKTKFGRNLNE